MQRFTGKSNGTTINKLYKCFKYFQLYWKMQVQCTYTIKLTGWPIRTEIISFLLTEKVHKVISVYKLNCIDFFVIYDIKIT